MEDADQIEPGGARRAVGGEQILGTQLIARALFAGVGVFKWNRLRHVLIASPSILPIMAPQHSLGNLASAWATMACPGGLFDFDHFVISRRCTRIHRDKSFHFICVNPCAS